MNKAHRHSAWISPIASALSLVTSGSLAQGLQNLTQLWEIGGRLRDKLRYHGAYEVLDCEACLELVDPEGQEAVLTRHEAIRFLQDNVVAIHDHAWGDGELFAEYHCQPGIPVDFYEDGSKWSVLISLRETKNRGDFIELWIQRLIRDGFRKEEQWLETDIDHWIHRLKLSIIFPQTRRCQRAMVTRRSTSRTIALDQQHLSYLGDGRQQLCWQTTRPKLHNRYTLKWWW